MLLFVFSDIFIERSSVYQMNFVQITESDLDARAT